MAGIGAGLDPGHLRRPGDALGSDAAAFTKTATSLWRVFSATAIGFTAVVLFGRAGEPVRPYLIAKKEGVTFSSQVAAWVVERILDPADGAGDFRDGSVPNLTERDPARTEGQNSSRSGRIHGGPDRSGVPGASVGIETISRDRSTAADGRAVVPAGRGYGQNWKALSSPSGRGWNRCAAAGGRHCWCSTPWSSGV